MKLKRCHLSKSSRSWRHSGRICATASIASNPPRSKRSSWTAAAPGSAKVRPNSRIGTPLRAGSAGHDCRPGFRGRSPGSAMPRTINLAAGYIPSWAWRITFLLLGCVLVLYFARAALLSRRATYDLELLLHGSRSIDIAKLQITGFHEGIPVEVSLTNRSDLEFLSSAFRHSSTNESGSFVTFSSRLWFSDGAALELILSLANDTSCIVVSREEWGGFTDPVQYRIPLVQPVPKGLTTGLRFLLTGKHT